MVISFINALIWLQSKAAKALSLIKKNEKII